MQTLCHIWRVFPSFFSEKKGMQTTSAKNTKPQPPTLRVEVGVYTILNGAAHDTAAGTALYTPKMGSIAFSNAAAVLPLPCVIVTGGAAAA
jgi:hypothetical protein